MGPANVYTYWDILKPHPIVRISICMTLLTFYRTRKFLNWRNILSWIPFGSDLDPNRFCKCNERERERETGAYTSFRENQSASADRGVCVCVRARARVCVFWISSFFELWDFIVPSADLCKKILIVRDVLEWLSGSRSWHLRAKAFWFSEVNESGSRRRVNIGDLAYRIVK